MKILIIGSKGFIGTHALEFFRRKEKEVFGCDVVVEYDDDHYFQVDATNAQYDDVFAAHPFDVCINCSGAASVPDSFQHPQRDFHLNATNVFNLLAAILRHNPLCKFVNLSSAAVYGNPRHLPVSELSPSSPVSPYGFHKFYAEQICREFVTFYDIKACSIRIFSAYGPGLRKQLFWDLYKKFKSNADITLYGTGNESRDFIHINDILEGVDVVIRNGSFDGGFYNLGSGVETTIRQTAQLFFELLKCNREIRFLNNVRSGDPLNWRADISSVQSLGFNPRISLEAGLRNYIEWLNENA